MGELSIGAYGNDVAPHLLEAILLLCQSSEFSRSDEGEVGWIEEEAGPASPFFLFGQADFAKASTFGFKGGQRKVRYGHSYL
jgi:hypothetical protein